MVLFKKTTLFVLLLNRKANKTLYLGKGNKKEHTLVHII